MKMRTACLFGVMSLAALAVSSSPACIIQPIFDSSFTQQEKTCALAAVADWESAIPDNLTFSNVYMQNGTNIGTALASTAIQYAGGYMPYPTQPWYSQYSAQIIEFNSNYLSQTSFDPVNPVPAGMYDGLSIFLHELGHALGFSDQYDAFSANMTADGSGNRYYAYGPLVVGLTPYSQGTHMSDSRYPNDLMVAGLGTGVRRGISNIDLQVLSDAYGYTIPGTFAPGDTNRDGVLNWVDITVIYRHLSVAPYQDWPQPPMPYNAQYDVNGDGVVSQADVTYELNHYFLTSYGDANLDKTTDFVDFQTLLNNWQAVGPTVGWNQGDFNGDGVVDFLDFQMLLNYWNPGGWNIASSQVPEPATLGLFACGAAVLARRGRRGRGRRQEGRSDSRSMGILPMSPTGVSPVVASSLCSSHDNDNSKDTGGTPVVLMGGTPMLRFGRMRLPCGARVIQPAQAGVKKKGLP
jgi:hypothetical protein